MFALVIVSLVFVLYVLPKILKSYNGRCYSGACLIGKTAVVTGGNSGVGFQIALNLASRGCRVIIADVDDSETSCRKIIEESNNENIVWKKVDLGSLDSVRCFAKDISESEQRLDILFNNAGCAGFPGEFTTDGLLKVVQINHFGHFLLVHLLFGLLKRTSGSRVIFTSSIAAFTNTMSRADDLNKSSNALFHTFNISAEYSNSKLAMVMCAKVLAKKFEKYGVLCFSVHPGTVKSALFNRAYNSTKKKNFELLLYYLSHHLTVHVIGKDAEEGAQTGLHCALAKGIEGDSGKYFIDCAPFWFPPPAKNDNFCEAVYKLSETLVQLEPQERIT